MQAFTEYREVCREVLDALLAYTERKEVVLSGEGKSLRRSEYDDTHSVKEFLSLIESEEQIERLLSSDNPDISIELKMTDDVPNGCSVVTASYHAGDRQLGRYGVVGPVRMDYQKVVSVLENVGKILENMIKK
jgi:heat-inducible transcriptional repressor